MGVRTRLLHQPVHQIASRRFTINRITLRTGDLFRSSFCKTYLTMVSLTSSFHPCSSPEKESKMNEQGTGQVILKLNH